MKNAFIFNQAPVGAHFTTGPSDRLYIKLDEQPKMGVIGGNCVAVDDGEKIWFPAGRVVLKATKADFEKAGFIYERNQHTNPLHAMHMEAVSQTLEAFKF